jgi:hypothetical protein
MSADTGHAQRRANGTAGVRDGLVGQLAAAGLAGFLSALGIGIVWGTAHALVSGGGATVGLIFLVAVAVGVGAACQIPAFLLLVLAVRCEPVPLPPRRTALWTLLLGSVGMIALNTVLVSGPVFLPPFGPVSVLPLCLPYPMAFVLVARRSRRTEIGPGGSGTRCALEWWQRMGSPQFGLTVTADGQSAWVGDPNHLV